MARKRWTVLVAAVALALTHSAGAAQPQRTRVQRKSAPLTLPSPACAQEGCFSPPGPALQVAAPPLTLVNDDANDSTVALDAPVNATVGYINKRAQLRMLNLATGRVRTVVQLTSSTGVIPFERNGRLLIGLLQFTPSGPTSMDMFDPKTMTLSGNLAFWGTPCALGSDGVWATAWNGYTRELILRRVGWDGSATSRAYIVPTGPCVSNGRTITILPDRRVNPNITYAAVVDLASTLGTQQTVASLSTEAIVSPTLSITVRSGAFTVKMAGRKERQFLIPGTSLERASVSSDGTRLAGLLRTEPANPDSAPAGLLVVSLETGTMARFEMPHNGTVMWTPDGTRLIVGLPDGLFIVDPTNGSRVQVTVPDQIPSARLVSITASS
jgi:hypothetical protein